LKAIDTNVVLRLLTGDDLAQEATARDLLRSGVFISLTVLMETEWVLRSFYRWPRDEIAEALIALGRIEGVSLERTSAAFWAVKRYRAGGDFADMIHLLVLEELESFATFDDGVARAAGANAPLPIETLV